eukprot:5791449-Prymnesium_polylepis.2
MRIFDAADYRKNGKPWPTASTSLKAGGWQSPEDTQREAALLSRHRVVHGSERHQYGGKRPLLPSEPKDGEKSDSEEEEVDGADVQTEPSAAATKRARC